MPAARTSSKEPRRPLRLGVVGCGRVFERLYLPAIKGARDWELVAAGDPSQDRLRWIRDSIPGVPTYSTFSDLVSHPRVDALLITTPPETHCDLATEALTKGLHVLVEKPLALTASEAEQMLQASQNTQKHLWIGFNRRYRRPYLELKKRLADIPRKDILDIKFTLISDSLNWGSVTSYLGNDSRGGGVLDDLASHQIDLLSWALASGVSGIRVAPLASDPTGARRLRYQVKLGGHLLADCEVGHGGAYTEYIRVRTRDRTLVACPALLSEFRFLPHGVVRHCSRYVTQGGSMLRRITHRPSFTQQSVGRLLTSFAETIWSGTGGPLGPGAPDGAEVVRAIEACRQSQLSGGEWQWLRPQEHQVRSSSHSMEKE